MSKKSNIYLHQGKTVSQWARKVNMPISTLWHRLVAGHSWERALNEPVGSYGRNFEGKNVKQWSKETGISVWLIYKRLNYGWSWERTLNTSPGKQGRRKEEKCQTKDLS